MRRPQFRLLGHQGAKGYGIHHFRCIDKGGGRYQAFRQSLNPPPVTTRHVKGAQILIKVRELRSRQAGKPVGGFGQFTKA